MGICDGISRLLDTADEREKPSVALDLRLLVDRSHMRVHGVVGDPETAGCLGIGEALGEQESDVRFRLGERETPAQLGAGVTTFRDL